jgi:hypothetical protein
MFAKIGCDCFGDATAQAAVDAENSAVDAIDLENADITAEYTALLEQAVTSETEDAGKLLKQAQVLKLRRLKNVLATARIPALKLAAEVAVKNAATTRTAELEQELAVVEERLGKAAAGLGYQEGDAMWHRVFHGDAQRRELKDAIRISRQAIGKTRFWSTEDAERATAELRAAIALLLK